MLRARDNAHAHTGHPDIPSRRALLAGSTASLVAGVVVATGAAQAAVASPQGADDDAELIQLCDRLVAIYAEEAVIFATMPEMEQDAALEATTRESEAIENRLYELGNPNTPAGMQSMARASVACAPKNLDGEITCGASGLAEWLAFGVVEALAGRTAA